MESVISRIINNTLFDIMHPSFINLNYYFEFIINKISSKLMNKADFSSEIFFWNQKYYYYYAIGDKQYGNSERTKNHYTEEMNKIIETLKIEFNEELKFIDVGSGPHTSYWNLIDINAWNIVTVDPLAKFYNNLNKKYKINYNINCIEGTGETLNNIFPPNSFHLVLSQNSIDHSKDPEKYINNLYYILKPGGFLYISGCQNEGEAEHWLGLHQYNIYSDNHDLFLTDKDKKINYLNMTKKLHLKLFYSKVDGYSTGDKFVMVYQKMKI